MEKHDRILGYFLEETVEHLNTIEQGLRKLPETVKQPTMIRELFRAAHSIKGSAAMLGLLDIQKIGNQFEANFKLLKEQPQIAVDNQLQSLFLESFSFLQAGIEEVRVSSDPYRQDPATPDPIGDPVFEELKAYLQHLLTTANPAADPDLISQVQNFSQDPAVEQVFGEYVTRKLDEIISLCLQPDQPEIRTQIQQICQKLGNLGENFEFLEWTSLFTACRLAIANAANPLPTLAESISIAVKQAQILVLADRHQSIGITPDLEVLINHNRLATSENINTWELENSPDPVAGIEINQAATTEKLQQPLEIGDAQEPEGLGVLNFDRLPPEIAFDRDEIELNEFINLLGEDLPSEGTWMQDEDFFDREILLQELGDVTIDESDQQTLQTVSLPTSVDLNHDLAIATAQNVETATYDEETFYTPDLGEIDDHEIANFLSDTQLAAAQHQPLYTDLDLLNSTDNQLQPDLCPPLDLVDISAPDFGLDRPMSELFPTVNTPEDWSGLEESNTVSSDIITTVDSISSAEIVSDANALDFDELPSLEANNFYPNLQPSIVPAVPEQLEPTDLEQQSEPRDRADWTPEIDSSGSDALCLEQLNSSKLPDAPVTAVAETSEHQIDPELASWIDNSIQQYDVDDLAEFNLDSLNDIEPNIDLFASDNLTELDLNPLGSSDLVVDSALDNSLAELNLDPVNRDNFVGTDLDFINSDELFVDASIGNNFTGLDLNPLGNIPIAGFDAFNSFADLDFDPLNLDNSNSVFASSDLAASLDFELFGSDELASLNLEDQTAAELAVDLVANELTDVDLNVQEISELEVDPSVANLLLDLNLNLDLDVLDDGELHSDVSIDRDLAELDLNPLDNQQLDLASAAVGDLDNLDIFNSTESEIELSIDGNFSDLDLNILNEDNVDNESQSSKFEDISELDFNLDDFSADISSHELTDLGSILDAQPESNLAGVEDLDALLGMTALGVGGAVLMGSNSAFDDLDALIVNPLPTADLEPNLDDLDRLLDTPVVTPPATNPNLVSARQPADRRGKQSRTFEQTMRVSVRHLDNLNNLVGELVVNRNTLEQDQTRMRLFVEKLLSEVQKLNEVGKRMQDLYERSLMENSLVASRQQSKPTIPTPQINSDGIDASGTLMEYDPLEMDRFTPIHLLSQKMIELTVRVRESTADIEFVVDGSTEVTRTLRQITGQLQEDLTKSRMVPFAQTADRLQRGVRDNGLKYGKQVELSVDGRDTLIDKVILESLTDPLIHMVNNAIAHGIESPASRQAAGKSIDGKITIRALHQGNQTIISVSDDGAGIDTEQVKAKAIEKGIITAQQATAMSKAETYELLFLPSFSTKDQADELAGRGVGMDVVRTSLTDIRGTITTESQLGVGTTFTIRLPLALSIAKALIAVNNKNNIAFPMDGIEDTQDVSPEQIQTNAEGERYIFWRDELMPFKPLSDLLGFNRPLVRNNSYSTSDEDSDLVSILILRSDVNLIAVQVDKITSDQEIVIKPLQGPASKPLGIAGATVMGDGRIIPIADVMELIALANGTLSRHVSAQWAAQMIAPTVEVRESMVLIVDDSITVRELLSLTFKRAGYQVEQARDGQEAWDKLRAGLPCDIVFCDIEMPRMDGLEFLSRIQKDVALSKVPVAMLTSRGSDRHRQIAAQLGASGYFIKPYLEEALLDAAKRMIKGEILQIV